MPDWSGLDMLAAMAIIVVIIVGFLAVAILYPVFLYNRLVTLRNRFLKAFSQIDVQLKRRHDLIPNVVQTAQGYLQHERGALGEVTAARAGAVTAAQAAAVNPGEASAMRELNTAEFVLSGALTRLMAVAENYPQLKANETMSALMEELTTTENRIAFARQAYNDAVMFYNTACQTAPTNLIAAKFSFAPAAFLQVTTEEERKTPSVNLS